jgi:histidyl-tRNA synthetase
MTQTLQAVRGMNDILPDEAERWLRFEDTVRDWLRAYGYRNIRMPLVEPTALFRRGIGEATDIVEKEMYSFVDALNGENLSLRPEGTASCVRAVIEHNLLYAGPQRLWYAGPMFRHERPQKGRYRQFHQVGVEALGFAGPDVDAEHLLMCARLWDDLGLEGIALQINSLGSLEERARHREALIAFLHERRDALDPDAQRRIESNPLRVLDSKVRATQAALADAPRLLDFLGEGSRAHFEAVQQVLRDQAVPYEINARLVRGLDYYNLTVYEWVTDRLGAQGTVCGGGRYDPLIELIGGKPAPACGFALGVERLIALMAAEEQDAERALDVPDVYLVHQGERADRFAFTIAERLRDHGFSVIQHGGGGGFKAQMKRADASGARAAVIVGEDEAAEGGASLKPLREAGEQRRLALDALPEALADLLYGEEKDGREQ